MNSDKEFYNLFIPFSMVINEMAKNINEPRDLFDNDFKARGIDVSKKIKMILLAMIKTFSDTVFPSMNNRNKRNGQGKSNKNFS